MKGKLARAKFVLWFSRFRILCYVAVPQKNVPPLLLLFKNALNQDKRKMEKAGLTFDIARRIFCVWGKGETSWYDQAGPVHPWLPQFQSHSLPISLLTVPRMLALLSRLWSRLWLYIIYYGWNLSVCGMRSIRVWKRSIRVWKRSILVFRVSDSNANAVTVLGSIPES